jgi:endonuclease G
MKITLCFSNTKRAILKSASIFLFGFLLSIFSFGQKVDTIIDKNIYTSYYSFNLRVPLYITYNLQNGGGNSKRSNFKQEYKSAISSDYVKTGYDRGHLVSAEDFAYNQSLENLTFSYYNCFPQNPKLNRGPWKSWEMKIRQESKIWPLKIYVGGIYGTLKLKNRVAIPEYCWKVVYNIKTKLLMHVLLFENNDSCKTIRVTLSMLNELLPNKIDFNPN